MEFRSKKQEDTYRQVGTWMREIFGESLIVREELPSYVVRAGSALVHIGILPWEDHNDSTVRIIAFVVRGPDTDSELTNYLLRENDDFRFGAFALDSDGDVSFNYTMIGSTLTKDALRLVVGAVGGTADKYDDEIVERWGGQTALDHLSSGGG